MTKAEYFKLKNTLIAEGYEDEIIWQTELQPVTDPIVFRNEAIWVIINSGMKAQVARLIHTRLWQAINDKKDLSTAFKHTGKVAAIQYILDNYKILFITYEQSKDKIQSLKAIPFIGPITCFHLAKNLGHDCIKPDRHLVRISKGSPVSFCKNLSRLTGDKVSVIDIVLWRAANLRLI